MFISICYNRFITQTAPITLSSVRRQRYNINLGFDGVEVLQLLPDFVFRMLIPKFKRPVNNANLLQHHPQDWKFRTCDSQQRGPIISPLTEYRIIITDMTAK
jgi:hypothetical protein